MRTLAWHETLELGELIASQAHCLAKFKMVLPQIQDPELRSLYEFSIGALQGNLQELLGFLSSVEPARGGDMMPSITDSFYAGDLLGAAKTAVRNYAIAITETATPELREIFLKQLNAAVRWHEKVFTYMAQRGLYPAYDLGKLLQVDVTLAQNAINM
ncbi:spore coat protein [Ectobacillus ponti]|uniref:Spore coat protein n=1 Tax=Ectobacillus ponti TaxID=2961894 RepID=A0AA42BQ84_9BACI|nr:spore coat protein [Ectobacillus ponti]MCP8969597.1 spore coat protein [Ectobacillus ponti]